MNNLHNPNTPASWTTNSNYEPPSTHAQPSVMPTVRPMVATIIMVEASIPNHLDTVSTITPGRGEAWYIALIWEDSIISHVWSQDGCREVETTCLMKLDAHKKVQKNPVIQHHSPSSFSSKNSLWRQYFSNWIHAIILNLKMHIQDVI